MCRFFSNLVRDTILCSFTAYTYHPTVRSISERQLSSIFLVLKWSYVRRSLSLWNTEAKYLLNGSAIRFSIHFIIVGVFHGHTLWKVRLLRRIFEQWPKTLRIYLISDRSVGREVKKTPASICTYVFNSCSQFFKFITKKFALVKFEFLSNIILHV